MDGHPVGTVTITQAPPFTARISMATHLTFWPAFLLLLIAEMRNQIGNGWYAENWVNELNATNPSGSILLRLLFTMFVYSNARTHFETVVVQPFLEASSFGCTVSTASNRDGKRFFFVLLRGWPPPKLPMPDNRQNAIERMESRYRRVPLLHASA